MPYENNEVWQSLASSLGLGVIVGLVCVEVRIIMSTSQRNQHCRNGPQSSGKQHSSLNHGRWCHLTIRVGPRGFIVSSKSAGFLLQRQDLDFGSWIFEKNFVFCIV